MKFVDEYRDPSLVQKLCQSIGKRARSLGKEITIMEVCGTHTVSIGRFGIRTLLPDTIKLISGPGCPVCVTSVHDVDCALYLAGVSGVIFATFGDMLRVPGSHGKTLQGMKARGADVRVVVSAMDCVELARMDTSRHVVFMGIGFETTSPTVALLLKECLNSRIENLSVLSVHKVIPPALRVLINDPELKVDGFLCPGHVSTIIGVEPYRCLVEAGRAAVITGFEPVDILEGILMILDQIGRNSPRVEIQYKRGVNPEGNPRARKMLDEVFEPGPAQWRGLGTIPESGLFIREEYAYFDAQRCFSIPHIESVETKGCRCGDVLRGILSPRDCPLFRTVCSPREPMGPCMVSSEGTCSAYYRYY